MRASSARREVREKEFGNKSKGVLGSVVWIGAVALGSAGKDRAGGGEKPREKKEASGGHFEKMGGERRKSTISSKRSALGTMRNWSKKGGET